MGRSTARAVLLTIAALAALCCSSCQGGQRFYPVRGTVLANGKPAYGVLIALHPEDDTGPKALRPSATTIRNTGAFFVPTRFMRIFTDISFSKGRGDYQLRHNWQALI